MYLFVYCSSNLYISCSGGQIIEILCFSESPKEALSDGALKSKVNFQPIFDKKPWAIYKWVKRPKLGCFNIFELNTLSCRVFYGLSDNHKIIEFGSPKQKLWPFETSSQHVLTYSVCM